MAPAQHFDAARRQQKLSAGTDRVRRAWRLLRGGFLWKDILGEDFLGGCPAAIEVADYLVAGLVAGAAA
jgi:hypothetical protein